MKYDIPIVVVAYNRPNTLKRLLDSLAKAIYPQEVRLIISIDKSDNPSILKIASAFNWKYGKKEVIGHEEHMGLRNHVLSCSDLASKYDAVIILEDDLFVSPAFYTYNLAAVDFYNSDKSISGISLYTHNYNETAFLPFSPLTDNSDTFFLQIPSSWGQCFTKTQWQDFKNWYLKNQSTSFAADSGVPKNIEKWPDSSWKKYFYKYMIVNKKFFVYPRLSLTTNFGDPGVHFDRKFFFQQVPLLTENKLFNFKKLSESVAVYDSHCEILPNRLVRLAKFLGKYSFDIDLYGAKEKCHITSNYILTSRQCKDPIQSFARELIPLEANIVNRIKGSNLFLANTESCNFSENSNKYSAENMYYFFKLRSFQLDQIAAASEIITVKNKLLSDYENQITNAKNIAEQKQKELEKIGIQLKYNDLLVKKQANVVSIAENQTKDRENQIARLQTHLQQKAQQLEQALDTGKTLAEIIREKDLLLETRNKELIKLKDEMNTGLLQIEKQNAKIEHLVSEINILNKEVIPLKLSLKASESKAEQLNLEVASLKQSIEEKESEVEKLKTIVTDLQHELETNIDVSEKLKKQLSALQENLNNAEEIKNRFQQENALLNSKLKSAQEKEKHLIETNRNLDKGTKELRDFIKGIEKSYTFRIGKAIIWPASKIKHAFRK